MNTQTNGVAAPQLTLTDFFRAADEARRLRNQVIREYRMHPEDIMELRRLAEPYMVEKMPDLMGVRFRGLEIIEDVDAPRLPRKARG